jgi:glycosyltransferase involved in cell wall biosynthesis
MKILILSWRGPGHPQEGGAEKVIHEYAKAWVKAENEVTLFTSSFKDSKKEEYIDGMRIIRSGNEALGVHLRAFLWYLFKRKSQYDLVIDNFHGIPFFTPFYVGTKKLAFIHEVTKEVTKEVWRLNPWPKPFNLVPYLLGILFEKWIFKIFYTKIPFITVSDSTKKELMEFGIPAKNITVINNGISIIEPKIKTKNTIKTIIFLGALTKDKGIDDALETATLLNQNEKLQFWIAGKGDSKVVKKILQVNNIRYWGYVSEEKKFELLRQSHVLINSSVREGWGLVVIEAAAMGTPTVGYNVAGLKDSILDNKTGILVKKNTPKDLAEEVDRLLNDEKKLKELSINAIRWSKNFNWKKSTDASLELINNL